MESFGLPMFKGGAFRQAFRGMHAAASAVFARSVYVRELARSDRENYILSVNWA